MATSLSSLKFTTVKKPAQLSPVLFRRKKLIGRIDEQISLAIAQSEGRSFAPMRQKTVKDENGVRVTLLSAKRVKAWWFNSDNGKLALLVRYGARVLNLSGIKGKDAIEIFPVTQLVPTLELLKTAVEAGEMDAAIEAAGFALRKSFGK